MPSRLDIPGIDCGLLLQTHEQTDTGVSRHIREHRIWEPYETSLLLDYLKPGHVFLDIGANIGYYTILASVIVGKNGMVFAYEPEAENFRLLSENITLNQADNVVPVQAAVSDFDGCGHLYQSPDNQGDHRMYDSGDGRCSRKARVINAGDHLRSKVNRVDFIKIDTQGSEYHILTGLRDIILTNRGHLTMIVEFWPYGLRLSGSSGRKLVDRLASFDMDLHIIDHTGHQLCPVEPDLLRLWADETDRDLSNQGFINLLVTPRREKAKGRDDQ